MAERGGIMVKEKQKTLKGFMEFLDSCCYDQDPKFGHIDVKTWTKVLIKWVKMTGYRKMKGCRRRMNYGIQIEDRIMRWKTDQCNGANYKKLSHDADDLLCDCLNIITLYIEDFMER
jgi:hypothetical protein